MLLCEGIKVERKKDLMLEYKIHMNAKPLNILHITNSLNILACTEVCSLSYDIKRVPFNCQFWHRLFFKEDVTNEGLKISFEYSFSHSSFFSMLLLLFDPVEFIF